MRRAPDWNTHQGLTPDLKLATSCSERGVSVADSAALAAQLLGCDDAVLLKVLLQVSSRVEFSMRNKEGVEANFHTTALQREVKVVGESEKLAIQHSIEQVWFRVAYRPWVGVVDWWFGPRVTLNNARAPPTSHCAAPALPSGELDAESSALSAI